MNLADQLKRAIDAAGRQPPPCDLWIKLPLSLAQRLYQVICQPHNSADWLTWAVEVWNGCVPIGTPVSVTNDEGTATDELTRSGAWQLGDGTPVVKVTNRTGGYLLRRVRPITQLCYRGRPLAECAAGGGDCDGCEDERLPGMQGAEIRAAARGTLAEQLWRACDAWEKAHARPAHLRDGGLEKRSAAELAAIVRQIREHANPEQLFARTDIAQVVGRLVALEAVVFDKHEPAYIRSAEHKAVEEAFVVLARLAPGLGSASLKAQAESISERFAALAPLVGAVAQWPITTQGIDPSLTRAYRRAKQALHGFQPLRMSQLIEQIERIIANLDGVISTPPKQWTKRALHDHLQAVKRDLERASTAS